MGLCPRSLLVRKKHQDGKVFQVERPDHLEAWVEALELGELDPGTERQVSKNLKKKTFFSGGCWKAIRQEWTGLSAVGTVNLLRCTRTPRSDGGESK